MYNTDSETLEKKVKVESKAGGSGNKQQEKFSKKM